MLVCRFANANLIILLGHICFSLDIDDGEIEIKRMSNQNIRGMIGKHIAQVSI